MRRDTLQDVELDGPATAPDPPQGRRRVWLGVGALVVVLALAGTQALLSAREDAAAERLQAVPGVLRPVGDTLEVVRRLTDDAAAGLTGEAGGTLSLAEDGVLTYRWLAPGEPGWARQLLPATRTGSRDVVVVGGSACEPDGAAVDADRIVCLVTDGAQVLSGNGDVDRRPATTTEIVVLGTADGSVLARWPLEHGTSAASFPGDLVVVASATDDTLRVTGHDVLTGAVRWTREEPATPGGGELAVFHAGDLVAVSTARGALRLLSRDGAMVRDDLVLVGVDSPEQGARWGWSTTPGGDLAILGQSADGRLLSTLVAADGDPAADRTIDGEIVPTPVDDGSVPGLLLTSDGSVHAWDAGTGRARWSADVPSSTNALVLRGRVYVATTAREVVALDGGSGREVWRSDELVGISPSALLTDGTHVLVATDRTTLTAEPSLVAYDAAGGDLVFRAPYPPHVAELEVLGHTLVGRDQGYEQVQLG
ncbi:hypothetical protein ASD16_18755 [Cellulomonas sp. Root485]|uniref:outer membrane protein assembly factor BamB family protein n=1 Tax=Cellulomonas sp. Root485 TaxID=1736546 RepID=UPI0006FE3A9D|nr:PQQ-binding-like beta-propeller repeat protein [Cellulomonas sp. Root485]KQY21341.1 hypothetical protein ASD16_18755 [Cellulomonas sp. Root485]